MSSLTDELTGLLSRKGFHIKAGERLKDTENLAVIWFNLDNFKMFNNRFGFKTGDELLCEISGIISNVFQGSITSRFSDDNFVILTDWAIAEITAEILQNELKERHSDVSLRLRAGIYFP